MPAPKVRKAYAPKPLTEVPWLRGLYPNRRTTSLGWLGWYIGNRPLDAPSYPCYSRSAFATAAIQKPGDVGMVQIGQNLPFVTEAPQDVFGAEAGIHELDGNALSILTVRAVRQAHGSHSPLADLSQDLIRPDMPAR
jgi:hypothetical protein